MWRYKNHWKLNQNVIICFGEGERFKIRFIFFLFFSNKNKFFFSLFSMKATHNFTFWLQWTKIINKKILITNRISC